MQTSPRHSRSQSLPAESWRGASGTAMAEPGAGAAATQQGTSTRRTTHAAHVAGARAAAASAERDRVHAAIGGNRRHHRHHHHHHHLNSPSGGAGDAQGDDGGGAGRDSPRGSVISTEDEDRFDNGGAGLGGRRYSGEAAGKAAGFRGLGRDKWGGALGAAQQQQQQQHGGGYGHGYGSRGYSEEGGEQGADDRYSSGYAEQLRHTPLGPDIGGMRAEVGAGLDRLYSGGGGGGGGGHDCDAGHGQPSSSPSSFSPRASMAAGAGGGGGGGGGLGLGAAGRAAAGVRNLCAMETLYLRSFGGLSQAELLAPRGEYEFDGQVIEALERNVRLLWRQKEQFAHGAAAAEREQAAAHAADAEGFVVAQARTRGLEHDLHRSQAALDTSLVARETGASALASARGEAASLRRALAEAERRAAAGDDERRAREREHGAALGDAQRRAAAAEAAAAVAVAAEREAEARRAAAVADADARAAAAMEATEARAGATFSEAERRHGVALAKGDGALRELRAAAAAERAASSAACAKELGAVLTERDALRASAAGLQATLDAQREEVAAARLLPVEMAELRQSTAWVRDRLAAREGELTELLGRMREAQAQSAALVAAERAAREAVEREARAAMVERAEMRKQLVEGERKVAAAAAHGEEMARVRKAFGQQQRQGGAGGGGLGGALSQQASSAVA